VSLRQGSSAILYAIPRILINTGHAAKIGILDSHISHNYTLNDDLSEPIYHGVL
jgi:hypothetical protein